LDVKVDIYRGPDPVSVKQARLTVDYILENYNSDRRKQTIEAVLTGFEQPIKEAYRKAGLKSQEVNESWKDDETESGIYHVIKRAWHKGDPAAEAAVSEAKAFILETQQTRQLSGSQATRYARLLDALQTAEQKNIEFINQFKRAFRVYAKGDQNLEKNLNEMASKWLDEIPNFSVRNIAASDEVEGRLVGTPLFDPKIALLSQKDDDWERFTINNFQTFAGTSQFVVVREGLLVYHQKNLDFDPTPAVGAGTAVSKLGLKVAAALATGLATGGVGVVAGLPATKGADGQSAGGQAVLPSSVDEGRIEIDRDKLRRWREARRNLLMSIANLMERRGASAEIIQGELKSEIDFYRQRIANSLAGR
jgi:hypothetical protein